MGLSDQRQYHWLDHRWRSARQLLEIMAPLADAVPFAFSKVRPVQADAPVPLVSLQSRAAKLIRAGLAPKRAAPKQLPHKMRPKGHK
jgi:hypothetical protein